MVGQKMVYDSCTWYRSKPPKSPNDGHLASRNLTNINALLVEIWLPEMCKCSGSLRNSFTSNLWGYCSCASQKKPKIRQSPRSAMNKTPGQIHKPWTCSANQHRQSWESRSWFQVFDLQEKAVFFFDPGGFKPIRFRGATDINGQGLRPGGSGFYEVLLKFAEGWAARDYLGPLSQWSLDPLINIP